MYMILLLVHTLVILCRKWHTYMYTDLDIGMCFNLLIILWYYALSNMILKTVMKTIWCEWMNDNVGIIHKQSKLQSLLTHWFNAMDIN